MATADTSAREKALFEQALDMASAAERLAFLKGACGEDAALLARVQALLQAHETTAAFLPEQPTGQTRLLPVTEKRGDWIGRYKLREKIGEGGCGVVYVVEQEEPVRRRVALKVIKLGMDTRSVVARFEAERQALAMMDHPNIAKVLDAGATATGRPYFVMELVRGIKITDYCDQNNLSTRQRLDLFIQVCRAVQHAHQKGIIHRDLKPSNILVTLHDGVPVPKVIDFGIAKATEGRLTDLTVYTELNQFIGTPAYMSPEQAEMSELDIDTRSDIYSLGVLLYELLTGQTPFVAEDLVRLGLDEMRRTIREKEPVRPSTRLSTMIEGELTATAKHRASEAPKLIHLVRGDLDWIVMKCLEKDRTRRYETANGLAMDIQRHLKSEPVLARPPSAAYRFQKAWRRNKLAYTAAVAVAAALFVGIGVSTWQAAVATLARREAELARSAETQQRLAAQQQRDKAQSAQHQAEQERARADTEKFTAQRNAYSAAMLLAQADWDNNNLYRMRQILAETQSYSDRGFEWFYWQRMCHLDLMTLRNHDVQVYSAAFSTDGQHIVSAGGDRTARVWDAGTGRELLALKGHVGNVWSVAYSRDGTWLVTASKDQTARLWDSQTGRQKRIFKGHTASVESVAFFPDGSQIVTGSADRTARVWDVASGRERLTLGGHSGRVVSVGVSPDGLRIVSGGSFKDGTVRVWDAVSGQQLLTLKANPTALDAVAFSPDGRRIASASIDGTIQVWDASSGRDLSTWKGHANIAIAVAFSPDGRWVVSGSYDRTAKVWDASTGHELFLFKGHSEGVLSAAFSPDGQRIITGSADGTIKVWPTSGGGEFLAIEDQVAGLHPVAFSPDGKRIAGGGKDGAFKIWDVASGRELLKVKGHSDLIRSLAFSVDGKRIASASWDRTIKLWEADTGRGLIMLTGHTGEVVSVAFSPDSRRVLSGSWDKTVKVWDAVNGRELLTFAGHKDFVTSAVFSPDGDRIVSGSMDGTAKVWEAARGRELMTLKGHVGWLTSVAFSPDGRRIVSGGVDGTIRVWDASTGGLLLQLKGHAGWVHSVAFFPNGRRIVSGGGDRTIKVWDAGTGRELLTLTGQGQGAVVSSVCVSSDGKRIGGGLLNDAIRVYEQASEEQVTQWQQEEQLAEQSHGAAERALGQQEDRGQNALLADEGTIKEWLILAPIALEKGQSEPEGLDAEQVAAEGKLRPEAGQLMQVRGTNLVWRAGRFADGVIDFRTFLGQAPSSSVAYAVSFVAAEQDFPELLLKIASDDQAKVYLNGQCVYEYREERMMAYGEDTLPEIDLKKGLNVVVFKIVNAGGAWQGSLRFTDKDGQPVKGLRASPTP